jgi:hypothetical protein
MSTGITSLKYLTGAANRVALVISATKGRGQIFYHTGAPRVPDRDALCAKMTASFSAAPLQLHRDHMGPHLP